ncbi:tetratricopeptide repeat protein [Streptomyces sp. NPDC004647]|uniref:tetratricopeptide repeat protein n=1 Tax=Streptomyces sp. NPDC004647 TaxID=3154671 RepID=UPI0033A05BA9
MVHDLYGRPEEAAVEAARALALGEAAQDPLTCCNALNLQGIAAFDLHLYEEAAEYFIQALNAFRSDGENYGATAALGNLGRVYTECGQIEQAIAVSEQTVASYKELGATLRLGNGYYVLGIALQKAGRHSEALATLRQALAVFQENRQRFWEGMTILRIAETELAAMRPGQAVGHAERALVLLSDVGSDWRRGRVLVVLGQALQQLGQYARARTCWEEALAIFDELGRPDAAVTRTLLAAPP